MNTLERLPEPAPDHTIPLAPAPVADPEPSQASQPSTHCRNLNLLGQNSPSLACISGSSLPPKDPTFQPKLLINKKSFPLISFPTRTALELPHEIEKTQFNRADQQSPSAHSPVPIRLSARRRSPFQRSAIGYAVPAITGPHRLSSVTSVPSCKIPVPRSSSD